MPQSQTPSLLVMKSPGRSSMSISTNSTLIGKNTSGQKVGHLTHSWSLWFLASSLAVGCDSDSACSQIGFGALL